MRKLSIILAGLAVIFVAYNFYVKQYLSVTLEIPVTIAMGDRQAFLITRGQALSYLESGDYNPNDWGKYFHMPALNFCLANFDEDTPVVNFRIFQIADILLAHGADINAADNTGKTALHTAIYYANLEVVKYLLEHHASLEQTIHAPGQSENGLTPLAYAIYLQELQDKKHDYQPVIDALKAVAG